MGNDYDAWNRAKRDFTDIIARATHINALLMGVGVPARTPSYILGRPPEFVAEQTEQRRQRRESD